MTQQSARTKVLLMAAGLGSRLRPLTDHVPKCLVPVGGRPLLDYWFDRFAAAGIADVLINTHHLREQVVRYIGSVNTEGRAGARFRVREAFEPQLLGSAGTIASNRAFADDAETILIVYGDNLSGVDLEAFLGFHAAHNDPITMLLFRTETPERCGIADVDSAMRITGFVEKPQHPAGNLANAGIYAVRTDAYREIADMAAFDIGFHVLPRFVGRMRGWDWQGYHLDIGTHESLARAEADLAAGCLAKEFRRQVRWSRPA